MKEYLLNCLEEDQSIVNELLRIDNKIQFTSLSIDDLVELINNITELNIDDMKKKYVFVTDGEINTTLNILCNYSRGIKCININKRNVAINKWLFMAINQYYINNDISIDIELDIENDYTRYESEKEIVICGYETFVNGTKELFDDNQVLTIIIE